MDGGAALLGLQPVAPQSSGVWACGRGDWTCKLLQLGDAAPVPHPTPHHIPHTLPSSPALPPAAGAVPKGTLVQTVEKYLD